MENLVLPERCTANKLRHPNNIWRDMQDQLKWDRRYLELAKQVSTWSKDPSSQIGVVLVNWEKHKEFIGYNGFPRGVGDSIERYNNREFKYKLVVHAEVNA